jgi:hypothetical protein
MSDIIRSSPIRLGWTISSDNGTDMRTFRGVLYATDFSNASQRAFRSGGPNNTSTTDLFKLGPSSFWALGANVASPLFHGGTLWFQRKAAIAAYEQSFANYRQTVLGGFAQVADTLQALEHDAQAGPPTTCRCSSSIPSTSRLGSGIFRRWPSACRIRSVFSWRWVEAGGTIRTSCRPSKIGEPAHSRR